MNVFITCTSEKASHRCKAKDMYTSALFQKCWEYAQTLNPDKIYILSAKHHLLNPNKEIDPYNAYLGDFSEEKKKEWAEEVYKEMKAAHIDFNAKTYFFAGEDYIKYLRDYFPNRKEIFKGKQIGDILHWIDRKLPKKTDEGMKSLRSFIKESLER